MLPVASSAASRTGMRAGWLHPAWHLAEYLYCVSPQKGTTAVFGDPHPHPLTWNGVTDEHDTPMWLIAYPAYAVPAMGNCSDPQVEFGAHLESLRVHAMRLRLRSGRQTQRHLVRLS